MTVTIRHGDCREVLKTMPDQSVHCCVTSPPYFDLRDYGHAGQIGLEATPDAFVAEMVAVFREVRRVLRDDGTLWLNLGDSYARAPAKGGSGPNGKNEDRWGYGEAQKSRVIDPNSKQATNRSTDLDTVPRKFRPGSGRADGVVDARGQRNRDGVGPVAGLKEKDLIGIPWRVAFALQADGWYLRQDIIWSKPNPMPESVTDRCTKAHEYIFLLSKSARYHYDADAILEPMAAASASRLAQDVDAQAGSSRVPGKTNGPMKAVARAKGNAKTFRGGGAYTSGQSFDNSIQVDRESHGNVPNETGLRNRRSVWSIATQPFSEAHFATFPPDLIEPCIKAGCPVGGTVLDPFGGAGTTGLVADRLQRDAILIELNPEYAAMADRRIRKDAGMFF